VRKKFGLFALAMILLTAAGVAMVRGFNNFTMRSLALVACIASIYLVRASGVHSRSLPVTNGQRTESIAKKGPGRAMWIIGAALVPVAAASYLYLYEDAHHGHRQILAVYLFAGVAMLCTLVWSYLASQIVH
jgi:hypothetical protein